MSQSNALFAICPKTYRLYIPGKPYMYKLHRYISFYNKFTIIRYIKALYR